MGRHKDRRSAPMLDNMKVTEGVITLGPSERLHEKDLFPATRLWPLRAETS
jgi:hypothetical protein